MRQDPYDISLVVYVDYWLHHTYLVIQSHKAHAILLEINLRDRERQSICVPYSHAFL